LAYKEVTFKGIFINTITKTEALNIYPSLLMVCVFGYVLSKRAEFQNEQLFKLASGTKKVTKY